MGRSLLDAQLGAMYHWYSLRWPRPLLSVSCRVCSWKQGTDGFLLQASLPLQLFSFTEVHGEANIWCLARLLGTTHSLLTPDSWAGHTVHSLYIYLMKWNHVLWSISFFPSRCIKRLNHLGHRSCTPYIFILFQRISLFKTRILLK